MTARQKVKLVASAIGEYSLSSASAAADLPKSTWYYHQQQAVDYGTKYAHLQPALEEIALKHPEYGYRRTLRYWQRLLAYECITTTTSVAIRRWIISRPEKPWNGG